ncbi:hypothetical protein PPYR_12482 [Photinus pyralis]|uniref:Sulfotransferase domain-containing protein n=1 Tax=Photinus pyralis TaxID=7054 RepID=A0A1Y1NFX8_PHOPY|nr:amine sulfotransferase-like [Photinus pyralis]XP_031350130.1 amine sulfotransferase-like [Photinus pyralis]XP_031350131.1 amine sulfotransferase-like [Photinus pyralis]XP_031350898.1 amine sulfotransferase-like [Photinus pyralis]KAB0794482.1 hypothetical protein PPYR_11321 [Photinus pyralis]KAB0795643.1 hypothetical protein PPYR_12482 [Photinus pyralis]
MPLETKEIVDPEIRAIIDTDFIDSPNEDFILYGDEETCLRKHFRKYEEQIDNFELRDEDIIVASFPKSGTTWIQEMVWLIKHRVSLTGSEIDICERFPMLEMCSLMESRNAEEYVEKHFIKSLQYIDEQKGQRFIKTHLPLCLLPKQLKNGTKQPKVIYAIRNPKDVFTSYYHHGHVMHGWKPNMEDFAKVYLGDKVLFGPYWKHVFGFYNMRHLPNFLIIKYEDMKKDITGVIEKVCHFLGEDPLTEEQLELLRERIDFKFMKNNRAVNYKRFVEAGRKNNPDVTDFMRSGTVGNYREEMSDELISKFDEWIKRNISNTDFDEDYAYGRST